MRPKKDSEQIDPVIEIFSTPAAGRSMRIRDKVSGICIERALISTKPTRVQSQELLSELRGAVGECKRLNRLDPRAKESSGAPRTTHH